MNPYTFSTSRPQRTEPQWLSSNPPMNLISRS